MRLFQQHHVAIPWQWLRYSVGTLIALAGASVWLSWIL